MLIGLTGLYCAGKNTVASLLEARGWTCIDVDRQGHEAMALAQDAIIESFGSQILAPDGSLDRRALASIVFSDPAALARQEAIVHPIAIRLTEEAIEKAEAKASGEGREAKICVNAALLHRMPECCARCGFILFVRAPAWLRLIRGLRRDHAKPSSVLRRMRRQRDFPDLLRQAGGQARILVIDNGRGKARLAAKMGEIASRLAQG